MPHNSRRAVRTPPRREDLQDYVEGRLNAAHRARIGDYLLTNPAAARRAVLLKSQVDAVRELGHRIMDEPVPARLKRLLKELFRPH